MIRIAVKNDPECTRIKSLDELPVVIDQLLSDGYKAADISPNLDDIRGHCLSRIKKRHAQMLDLLTGSSTVEERDTWPRQQLWATSYLSSDMTYEQQLKMLSREGESLSELAQTIIDKAQAVDLLIATAGNIKRTTDYDIDQSSDWKDMQTIMDHAAVKAETAKAEYLQAIGKT